MAAKYFYLSHKDFYYAEPKNIKHLVAPKFYLALNEEHNCSADTGNLCAIDADPWIDAQDGELSEPINFENLTNLDTKAIVKMSYIFLLSPNKKMPQTVTMHFERSKTNACWLLSDFITPNGGSLLNHLESWHKRYAGQS